MATRDGHQRGGHLGTGAASFVHLRTHSAYSLLEGALTIAQLAKLSVADSMPALALTDSGNMFAALEFSEKLSGAGVQPIIGITLRIALPDEVDAKAIAVPGATRPLEAAGSLVLLAKDDLGYANLMKLASAAYLDNREAAEPLVTIDQVARHTGGVICLTGGPAGVVDTAVREGHAARAAERLDHLKSLFGDRLYVELQRHGLLDEKRVEPVLIELAYEHELPLVATNEPYFATADDYEAHDALICVAEGTYVVEEERRRLSSEHYFKTQKEMVALFADLPEALENTLEIAQRCAFRPRTRAPILPQFVSPAEGRTSDDQVAIEAEELRRQAMDGLRDRLDKLPLADGFSRNDYEERLAYELDVINRMKFPGYFLIVADFIKWSKAQGIPVGPGRGSGAGSLVAWSLTITDLDPMRFGLLFERFLNPERVSMPDFDIDFCQDRRDEVIRYVQKKYGEDRVAQIITFGRLQARAVLRDIGRVLQIGYGQVNDLCKLVPNNPANPVTLAQALQEEPKLQEARERDDVVDQLVAISLKLEGLNRNASTHAAGVVIGDRPLDELVPLYRDPRSELPATQFNMKWVEPAGLVKFDFLGLKTLTVIQKAVQLVARSGTELDLASLPLDDAASYELLARGDTVGVFQLESTGMRDSLRKLKPDRFEDIIAMVSLYRPGPMDNIPTYINRKHGTEEVDYLHPMLKPTLEETYGVIIYQEQVQKIAQVMAGYSLGEADLLRRAMGKKIKEEMDKQKTRFVEGAVERGVARKQADFIFELVNKFAGYGFNKSHAAAYALLSYHTAYLKANYPVEFLAASMTLDMANTDKLALFAEEARSKGIAILPPSINASEVEFLPENGGIRYALAALKNFGRSSAEEVVRARQDNPAPVGGKTFVSLAGFAERINPQHFNRRAMETLIAAGALDDLGEDRAIMHGNADGILSAAQRRAADENAGQNDLFGGGGAGAAAQAQSVLQLRKVPRWTPMERLAAEHGAIGFYLSGHPLDEYEKMFERLELTRWSDFESRLEEGGGAAYGKLAAIVVSCKERRAKSGKKFAFATFSDQTGQFEAVLFSDTLSSAGSLLKAGTPVVLAVEGEREGDAVKVRCQSLTSLDKEAARLKGGLCVVINSPEAFADLSTALRRRGNGEVELLLRVAAEGRQVRVRLPDRYDVSPSVIGQIQAVPGVVTVHDLTEAA